MPAIDQGGVYQVADAEVVFVPSAGRTTHESRFVVVVSGPRTNDDPTWPLVLVVPCSGQSTYKTALCVKLNYGDGNLQRKCWARVPAVQALQKVTLADRIGKLPEPKLEEILTRLVEYLGIT